MVINDVVLKRLARLEESLKRLELKRNVGFDEFKKSWELQDIIIKEFEVAIECIIDIGAHIISEKNWGVPSFSSEIPDILVKNGLIPEEYSEKLKKIIAFRNILVHEYLYIDLEKVYKNLQNLQDLKDFVFYLKEFIGKE